MATIAGTVKGVRLENERTAIKTCLVSFTMPAYTAASDNGELTAIGAAISARKKNGKTVTLLGAHAAGQGLHGTTGYRTGTWAVSSDNLTFNLNNTSNSETDAASGVSDVPLLVSIAYTEA